MWIESTVKDVSLIWSLLSNWSAEIKWARKRSKRKVCYSRKSLSVAKWKRGKIQTWVIRSCSKAWKKNARRQTLRSWFNCKRKAGKVIYRRLNVLRLSKSAITFGEYWKFAI